MTMKDGKSFLAGLAFSILGFFVTCDAYSEHVRARDSSTFWELAITGILLLVVGIGIMNAATQTNGEKNSR